MTAPAADATLPRTRWWGQAPLLLSPDSKCCLQNEMHMLPSPRTSMFCGLSFTLPARLSGLFLHLSVIILVSPDPQGLSFNLTAFLYLQTSTGVGDLPRLLVSPPGVDTVAALPAPEIPPFLGVPDQMSSSGL